MKSQNQIVIIMRNISPLLAKSFALIFAAMLVFMAIQFQNPDFIAGIKTPSDFHAFYMSGEMFWAGELDKAYYYEEFAKKQESFFGELDGFLAWSYPPPFNLITSVLALLPIGLSYFLFTSATLISYILTIRAISPRYFVCAIFAVLPAVALNIRTGQNGLLTGALIGVFLLAFMRRRAGAGLPLGLMIIKPHLAAGITVITFVGRRWSSIGIASVTVASILSLATFIFGFSIWGAFINGVMEASSFLKGGAYPLHRMTSIYAALYTFGVPPAIALGVQVMSALIACSVVAVACIKNRNSLHVIGITAVASLYISPYSYDYDMTLLGISVAAFLPEISKRAKSLEMVVLIILCWLSCGSGVLLNNLSGGASENPAGSHAMPIYSIASISLTLLLVMSAKILGRPCCSRE